MQLIKNIGKLIGFVVLTALVAYFGALLALWTYEHTTTPLIERVDATELVISAVVKPQLEVVIDTVYPVYEDFVLQDSMSPQQAGRNE